MELYISERTREGRELVKFCDKLKVADGVTKDDIMNAGFTNFSEPYLYFCKKISQHNSLIEVTLNIDIDKESLQILNIMVLCEDYLQPIPVNKFNYDRAIEAFNMLRNKGILEITNN